MATDTYALWCLIGEDKSVFLVRIPIDSDINRLKDMIKQKRSRSLKNSDAAGLILWKVRYF